MEKMHRAQILLEPEQHRELSEIARLEGASISEIVRAAVNAWLAERKDEAGLRRKLEALEQINQHRQAFLDRREGKPLDIDLTTVLHQIREERDDELLGNI